MNNYKERIEQVLRDIFAQKKIFPKLKKAMEYSVLDGGKRLRPLLVYITGRTFNAELAVLDAPAAAIELIHCYSLVHDDLPAMDDDDLRRGKPSCHRKFDEATAILAGDALQSLAFEMLSTAPIEDSQKIRMMEVLAKASGSEGMVGGQAMDLASQNQQVELDNLIEMHALKTGALFQAAIRLGALASNCDEKILGLLDEFSKNIGLAFQIQDDILDVEGSSEKLGKHIGADLKLAKATYPSIVGLREAKLKVRELQAISIDLLKSLPCDSSALQGLSLQLTQRDS